MQYQHSSEISINFLNEKPKINMNLNLNKSMNMNMIDDELSLFLNKNGIKINEISDIILKYKNINDKDMIYKEIENYLNIKKEIETFPIELQDKVLQYARDTAHIGVDPKKIKQQIKNELLSIQNAKLI